MAYEIIYKKRFVQKLFILLDHLNSNWSKGVADKFINELQKRLSTLLKQPYIGAPSTVVKSIRSILITKHNRIYYRIKGNQIEVVNMYDLRINPTRNRYM